MKKYGIVCTGQGSQYVGMGKELCAEFSVAKRVFEEADEALGFELSKMCFEGDSNELAMTYNTQPATLTLSYAMYKAYIEKYGVLPTYLAGHSLGEYTALVCSGAMNFNDAVKIVRRRGELMQELAGDGGMMVIIRGDLNEIMKECEDESIKGEFAQIANYNSSEQIVLSGSKKALGRIAERYEDTDVITKMLSVSAPFHSKAMRPAADKLAEELGKYTYNDIQIPVMSNYTGRPYESKDAIIHNLTKQLYSPVRWNDIMVYLNTHQLTAIIEIGPKTALKKFAEKDMDNVKAFAFDKAEDRAQLSDYMTWKKGDPTVITRCMAVAVATPNNNWDNVAYENGVVKPYKEIEKIQDILDESGEYPSEEQMRQALDMLISVFETKQTPMSERNARIKQILNETGTRTLFYEYIK